ncbi:MAG: alpha/beta fold hydrolase [Polyangiales bacterium]
MLIQGSGPGREIFVRELGDAAHPSVVFVHSSGMSGGQWRRHSLLFRDAGYHVLVPDLIGCGRSEAWGDDSGRFEAEADMEVIASLAKEHGPVILIGHSYGGALALKTARALRGQITAVAVYDPVLWGPHREIHGDGFVQKMKERGLLDPALRGSEEWMSTFVEYWGGEGAWERMAPLAREQMMRSAAQTCDQALALSRDEEGAETYAAICAPALVLSGSETPPEMRDSAVRVAEAIPRGEHKVLPGGHMVPLTHTELFCEAVLSWVRASSS